MKIVIILLIAGGCMKQSEKYCAMHPEDTENCSGGGDGGMACLGNNDCMAIDPTKPLCTDDRMCVECTIEDISFCAEGEVCRGRTCGDCTMHTECASNVCQTNGRCADATMVAYLDPNGGGDQCTLGAPCNDAVAAEATARPIIKVTGTIVSATAVLFDARSTTIYAEPGAAFTRSTPGSIIQIENDGTELTIYDLRIFGGAPSGNSNGISFTTPQTDPKLTLDRVVIDNNDGSGVRASDGGIVTITRSVIANNTGSQGLVLQNAVFDISNTVIAQNGKSTLTTGGALLFPSGPSKFEFNTVADNISMGGATNYRNISCLSGFDIENSIVVGGDTAGCDATYTMFSAGDMLSGTGNKTGDPAFKSTSMPTSAMFYRLMPASPAKDMADAAATLTMDIDGNMRPIDGRSDMGADEVSP